MKRRQCPAIDWQLLRDAEAKRTAANTHRLTNLIHSYRMAVEADLGDQKLVSRCERDLWNFVYENARCPAVEGQEGSRWLSNGR